MARSLVYSKVAANLSDLSISIVTTDLPLSPRTYKTLLVTIVATLLAATGFILNPELNLKVLVAINQGWSHPFFDVLFQWISARSTFSTPLLLLIGVILYWKYKKDGLKLWGVFLLMVGLGDILGNIFKQLISQPRPCAVVYELILQPLRETGSSCGAMTTGMPSNHALNFFLTACFLGLALRSWRWFAPLMGIAIAVALSRIYLGAHYPSQVLVGGYLGCVIGSLAALQAQRRLPFLQRTQQVRQASASTSFNAPQESPIMRPSRISEDADKIPMTDSATEQAHHLSIVVPVYNEEDNVAPLVERVHEAMNGYPHPWELILVNDGSSDETFERGIAERERLGKHLRIVDLQRNFGQTAAMQAGIDVARGDVIVTMDGDLQNDPIDIPRMVTRLLEEDLDMVAGWRKNRKDALVLRKIPSRIANKLIRKITHVHLNDYGCSLKVYRASIIKNVRLYGEMHRFIPAWVATNTKPNRIKEEVVTHHARQFGESKYGISRTFRVVLDLLSVYFFMRYKARPGHFFGSIGLAFGGLGGLILAYLFMLKLFLGEDIGGRPLLLVGILFVVMSVQFLTTGVLAELMSRTYFESGNLKSYSVRNEAMLAEDGDEDWHRT